MAFISQNKSDNFNFLFDYGRGPTILWFACSFMRNWWYLTRNLLMPFTLKRCQLYVFQVKLVSSVGLLRHSMPNSSSKVPFAHKHGWIGCFLLGARTCLSLAYRCAWTGLKNEIKVRIDCFFLKHAHWTLLINFRLYLKIACLHDTDLFYSVLIAFHLVPFLSQNPLLCGIPFSWKARWVHWKIWMHHPP
jgi:hypothetical protein